MAMKHLLVLFGALIAGPVYASPQSPDVAVVAVYEGMASYAEAVAANPTVDRGALWREKVMNPYWQRCTEGGEYINYAPPLATPIANIESLRASAAALRAAAI